jgi:hypothetical protein
MLLPICQDVEGPFFERLWDFYDLSNVGDELGLMPADDASTPKE